MDTFRLILIFLGLAILFLIYILETQRRRKQKQRERAREAMEGEFEDDPLADGVIGEVRAVRDSQDDVPPAPPIGAGILGDEMPPMTASHSSTSAGQSPPVEASPQATAPAPVQEHAPAFEPASFEAQPPATPEPIPQPAAAQTPPPAAVEPVMQEADEVPEPPDGMADLIIALQVVAREGTEFAGRELQDAFRRCNLEYGEMRIYHRYTPRHRTLFFAANAVEPGSFDLTRMAGLSTPGVVFFLRLPTVLSGRDAFDLMHTAASDLAAVLGGEVQDQQRNTLGKHELTMIRERIAAYEHKIAAHRREMHG